MYLVYHDVSLKIIARCETMAGARRSATKANKKSPGWVADTQEHYDAINVMTTTYNMLDPERKPIPIRLADKGGCCDPATEMYHTM